MTTTELVRLIEADTAGHRLHQCDVEHPMRAPIVTIGSLSTRAGTPRRSVEEAIQTARLDGVPVITDGGIRVAGTADEALALYRWLRARMLTQSRTVWAVRSQALMMQRAERAAFKRAEFQRAADLRLRLWDVA